MGKLLIEATKSTPFVEFDPASHKLSIMGQSYPENAFKFYEPVFAWLDAYLEQIGEQTAVVMELHLPYINTSSTKCFIMLLEKLEEAYQKGRNAQVSWFYDPENDSELECAEEFKEDLSLPFHIIPKQNEA